MENISNKTEASINAGSTVQQIEQSFKDLTLEGKVQIIREWIDDEQDANFPVCLKSDEVYKNFLNYIFIDSIDETMNNSKPFVHEQNYSQETRRIISYLYPTTDSDDAVLRNMEPKDKLLMDLYYATDCAIQDRFFGKLKANEVNKTNKLW